MDRVNFTDGTWVVDEVIPLPDGYDYEFDSENRHPADDRVYVMITVEPDNPIKPPKVPRRRPRSGEDDPWKKRKGIRI